MTDNYNCNHLHYTVDLNRKFIERLAASAQDFSMKDTVRDTCDVSDDFPE